MALRQLDHGGSQASRQGGKTCVLVERENEAPGESVNTGKTRLHEENR